jgi:hypothetical protein
MRTGLPWSTATRTICVKLASRWRVPTLPGVDAVLVERRGGGRVLREQQVAVVVEVAHERHGHAQVVEAGAQLGDGGRGLVVVDRDAHDLGAGARERRHLLGRRGRVGGVGVGHRLHHDRVRRAHRHRADQGGHGGAPAAEGCGARGGGDAGARVRARERAGRRVGRDGKDDGRHGGKVSGPGHGGPAFA